VAFGAKELSGPDKPLAHVPTTLGVRWIAARLIGTPATAHASEGMASQPTHSHRKE